jgi:hypothetical protein
LRLRLERALVFYLFFAGSPAYAQINLAPAVNYGTGLRPEFVEAADLDGDNVPDLVSANDGVAHISVLLGNGDGTFGAASSVVVDDSFALATGDLDGDGALDVVTVSAGIDEINVLLGNGNGTFGVATSFAVGSIPNSVTLADFNEDGDLDAAVGNGNNDGISVLLGNGNGTFDPAVGYAPATGPVCVLSGDLNQDGDLDLVASDDGQTFIVLLGNGNGTFDAPVTYFTGGNGDGMQLALGDLNGDGNLDTVTAHRISAEVGVSLGNGDGTFDPTTRFPAVDPATIAVADINGDGRLDVVAGNLFGDSYSVLEGNGDGTLDAAVTLAGGGRPSGLAIGDFDLDGDLDIAGSNSDTSNVSVFLNLRPPSTVGINGAPCAYNSIADAALNASSGDTIYASPGTYAEPQISMFGFALTIVSSDAACAAVTSHLAAIEPAGANRVFRLDNSDLTLIGLTVQDSNVVQNGGLIHARNGSALVLQDTTVTGGNSNGNGGCIYAIGSNIEMSDGAELVLCHAVGSGGAIYLDLNADLTMEEGTSIRDSISDTGAGGAVFLGGATAVISGEIVNNSAIAGGGLYVAVINGNDYSDVEVNDHAVVKENNAQNGGGAYVLGSSTQLRVLDDARVELNAAERGAGIYAIAAQVIIEDRALIQDNDASIEGGGIYASQSQITLTGSALGALKIRRNTALEDGGGLFLNLGTLTSSFVTIDGNEATLTGGGIYIEAGTIATLTNTRLLKNIGTSSGGGMYIVGPVTAVTMSSDFVACNTAGLQLGRFCSEVRGNDTDGTGGGVRVVSGGFLDVSTTSFVGNFSPLNGEAVMVSNATSRADLRNALFLDHLGGVGPAIGGTTGVVNVYSSTFSNNSFPIAYFAGGSGVFHRNIVWGNTNDSILVGISGNCNTTQTAGGAPAGVNNNQLNPLFDAGNARSPFKLQAASPAVDACLSGPTIDLDGAVRPIGGIWDKGAFER